MSFLGKLYKHDKDENFDAFLNSLGLPEEFASKFFKYMPEQKLEKNGDTYTLTAVMSSDTKVINFKDGEEFEEKVLGGTRVAKTTFTFDGNTLTQVQKHDDGNILTTKREYFDDKLIVTLTRTNWDGVAVRYYKV